MLRLSLRSRRCKQSKQQLAARQAAHMPGHMRMWCRVLQPPAPPEGQPPSATCIQVRTLCSDECERSECCEGAQHPGQSRSPTACAAQAGDFGAQMTLCGTRRAGEGDDRQHSNLSVESGTHMQSVASLDSQKPRRTRPRGGRSNARMELGETEKPTMDCGLAG